MSPLRARAFVLCLLLACALPTGCTDPDGGGAALEIVGDLRGGPVDECSGLTRSRRHEATFWAHNDAGDGARLYAVALSGETRAEINVLGADHVDWEDITSDDDGFLYVGDIGNNESKREDLVVYRVPEPDLSATGAVTADLAIEFRYPDQLAFPDPAGRFDAESLFWSDGTLYLLTKRGDDDRATLYRFPNLTGDKKVVLDRVGDVELGSAATAADGDDDGLVAVLGRAQLAFFEHPGDAPGASVGAIKLDLSEVGQAEAVTWDDGAVVVANEEGDIFRLADPLAAVAP